jgi:aldehyde dehydrogenase family 7 protein A1
LTIVVLYVATFDTLEEAVALNNSVEQGLSSSLFTSFVFRSLFSTLLAPYHFTDFLLTSVLSLSLLFSLANSVLDPLPRHLSCRNSNLSNAYHFIGPAGSDCGIININGSTSGAEIGARFGGNKVRFFSPLTCREMQY